MNRRYRNGTVLALVLLQGGLSLAVPTRAADRVEQARRILKRFLEGHYEEFVAAGDQTMRSKFSAEQARQVGEQLTALAGTCHREVSAALQHRGEYDAVLFTLACEKAVLRLEIVLDAQGRMAGFWSKGIEPLTPYKPPAYVNRDAFREENVTVRTGQFELPGTLSLPRTREKHAAVVLVHGSGPHDQDETVLGNKPFRDLAWGLASRGVAVLRYEKRTYRYPERMNPQTITLEQETIDDALSAVKLLRERPDIDASRVFVLGHSLGGMAAPYIAQRDPQLAGIIIMSGPARPILDLLEDQIEYIARSDGKVTDTERAQIDQTRRTIAALRAGRLDDAPTTLLGAPVAYWARLQAYDPLPVADALHLPILIIHGARDYQVTQKDYDLWRSRLGRRPNVTIRQYARLNHLMVAGDGPSTPAEYVKAGHVDEQVVRDIAAWIRSRGGGTQPAPGASP